MFHVILDIKVILEIYESEGILMHSDVVHSVFEIPDFLILSQLNLSYQKPLTK